MRDRWIPLALIVIGGIILIVSLATITTPGRMGTCTTQGGTSALYLPSLTTILGGGLIAYALYTTQNTSQEPAGQTTIIPEAMPDDEEPVVDVVLDVLPEDERVILEPVVCDPGVTQVEVTNRSNLSKSKVSQVLVDLEERGLVYREKQGRTYRVYPGQKLKE